MLSYSVCFKHSESNFRYFFRFFLLNLHCVFSHWNSDFADEMNIISKKYSNNYRIDLRSYFETRELIWSFKAIGTEEVETWQKSGNSQTPGTHPEIWSVTVPSPPPNFKTKTIKISLEAKSAYRVVLQKCHENGRKRLKKG